VTIIEHRTQCNKWWNKDISTQIYGYEKNLFTESYVSQVQSQFYPTMCHTILPYFIHVQLNSYVMTFWKSVSHFQQHYFLLK